MVGKGNDSLRPTTSQFFLVIFNVDGGVWSYRRASFHGIGVTAGDEKDPFVGSDVIVF